MYPKMKGKIFFESNGCSKRTLDLLRLKNYFQANNCEIVHDSKEADYTILMTCSFKKSMEDQSFEYIDKYSQGNSNGELIVLGCLPETVPKKFKERFQGRSVSTKNLEDVDKLFPHFQKKFSEISNANTVDRDKVTLKSVKKYVSQIELSRESIVKSVGIAKDKVVRLFGKENRPMAYLQFSRGCSQHCTFCLIRKAVGKIKSKPIDECTDEYRNLLKQGYKRFTILADNTGMYGVDINSSFAEVLRKLSEIDTEKKVNWYIRDLHPRWLLKYKEEILKYVKNGKIVKITCPIQSGSPRILKLMQRYQSVDEISKCFKELKSANPDLELWTHIIAGFPTETNEEFQESIDFILETEIDEVGVFQYYGAEGAASSQIEGKIDENTIKERLAKAIKIFEQMGVRWDCDDLEINKLTEILA